MKDCCSNIIYHFAIKFQTCFAVHFCQISIKLRHLKLVNIMIFVFSFVLKSFSVFETIAGKLLIAKSKAELSQQLENVLFHQDNSPAHTAATTQLETGLLGFDQITHPPYSPDLAPMDFTVVPHVKAELGGIKFTEFCELKRATLNAVRGLDEE